MIVDLRDYDPLKDINLLGATSLEDVFNGANYYRASKPVHVKGLLEDRGIVPEAYPGEHVDDYCALTNIWLGDSPVLWEQISALMPVGRARNRPGIIALFALYGRNPN